jgi:hypothetical protein
MWKHSFEDLRRLATVQSTGLFERRLAYRRWQRLSRNSLPVMETAAET